MADNVAFCQGTKRYLIWLIALIALILTVGTCILESHEFSRKKARRGQRAPEAGIAVPAALSVDAVTKATPKGGVKLIAQPSGAETLVMGQPAAQALGQNDPLVSSLAIENVQEVLNNVAATVKPAVVHIETIRASSAATNGVSFQSIGSGVIIDRRGYVLTNYHVLKDATKIDVTVYSKAGRAEYDARIVDSDIRTDLAVLKILGDLDFPVARLGDAANLQVGDLVLAVGSPLDLAQTVSFGIVSALREAVIIDGATYSSMIQTDAHINKGNSGGPLVNVNGEVIGINTAIYTPEGSFTGVGFAIPITLADTLLDELNIAHQRFSAALANLTKSQMSVLKKGSWFGVEGFSLSPSLEKKYDLTEERGVYVTQLFVNSPADLAGVQQGDILTMFDNVRINGVEDLRTTLSNMPAGKQILFRVCRNGAMIDLATVTTAKW